MSAWGVVIGLSVLSVVLFLRAWSYKPGPEEARRMAESHKISQSLHHDECFDCEHGTLPGF